MLVGSKWYRFDFHSHSPASDDYAQLDLTEREWLLSYMRKSVDAVVLTDHNTGKQADKLKAELELMRIEASTNELPDYRPLVLFPGVELTATGDVHVIAMFDEDASSAEIEQLIGQCNVNAPIPRGRNDATVLQGSVPTILANIAANPNILSILAHIDGPKGVLGIQNQGELVAAFKAKPDAVEVRGCVSDIQGLNAKLIEDLPKLRGSDAHHTDYAGTRTCWLKMSELNFAGVRNALLDHENCVLADGEPPKEPKHKISKLEIKSKLCHDEQNSPVSIRFNPFYNAIVGSRGSGKSTLIESIRLALRRDTDLPGSLQKSIDSFKKVGRTMDADSYIECIYTKENTDFKMRWSPTTQSLQVNSEGNWVDDENWSNERFGISIYSQKTLFELASDNSAFLRICDESEIVNKAEWNSQMSKLTRDYKTKCIELRELHVRKKRQSTLQGQHDDAARSIDRLKESPYYAVKTTFNDLERELSLVKSNVSCTYEHFNKLRAICQLPDFEVNDVQTIEQQLINLHLNEFKQEAIEKINSALDTMLGQIVDLSLTGLYRDLLEKVSNAETRAKEEYSALEQQDLEPDELDNLIATEAGLTIQLEAFAGIDEEITKCEEELADIESELVAHRKLLSSNRIAFIESLELDELLRVKVLPLNAQVNEVVSSYQSALGITAFSDKIYDPDTGTGFLKDFIERQTFSPIQQVIDAKYEALKQVKNNHFAVHADNLSEEVDINGAFRNKLKQLTEEHLDALACWFPEDGIEIRFKALNGTMENIENASPGQKAASMLQFLLSYGTDPLLLDQPEDDLDCMMLSDSVIPAIAMNKQRRQLIVVSHSAPIVVNGDAEYVISMVHDRHGLRPNVCGALQEKDVKEMICNQMEGGEKAFRSRFSRILAHTHN
ncbi:TPA: histidinol phosphatase [Vibrio cholerae]|uniref:anti-phage protein Ppl n=1 Tax=Vibrio cholerae TaxID=666 RepID=UPI000E0C9F89|nr:anti-phage protein Ppl [Vibrio cholerae]EJN3161371.1 histidinol phosphatase [Vibrio cholerae]EKF9513931.1 histidinol phosphatase [Vibrio cholerae]MBO1399920.1 histidinol phosphatase [Vibrio cholerae]MDV2332138.1 histidinol phosphatase [Vibrio cholerae]HDZ3695621.1 histidinol phosphatase [Vibrio cholerae]